MHWRKCFQSTAQLKGTECEQLDQADSDIARKQARCASQSIV